MHTAHSSPGGRRSRESVGWSSGSDPRLSTRGSAYASQVQEFWISEDLSELVCRVGVGYLRSGSSQRHAMFKRLSKFNTQKQRNIARGIDVSQDAPPEVLMDEESGSESDSDSDEEEEASDDDDQQEASNNHAHTSVRSKKRKSMDDDIEDSDADSNSSAETDEDDEGSSEEEEPYDDSVPPISLSQSLESPLYISPLSPHKAGEPWTTCLVCPLAQLKSSTAVEVHQQSKAHKRRYVRYVKYVEERLTETERTNDFEAGGADPRGVVKEIEGESQRSQGKAKNGKPPPQKKKAASDDKQQTKVETTPRAQSEKARARSERKKAHKKAWKEAKEERKKQKKLAVQEQEKVTASGADPIEADSQKSQAPRDEATLAKTGDAVKASKTKEATKSKKAKA